MSGQATVAIGSIQWLVSVATTPAELTQGLGGLTSIPAGRGTLRPRQRSNVSVTTQPMLFNLDIIFISSSLQVVDVLYRPCHQVRYSLRTRQSGSLWRSMPGRLVK